MIDMAVFHQFQEAIRHLGEMARPEPMADDERVARAKAVMRRKTDRGLALDLESCVNCGYCSEACHFYQPTQDPGLHADAASSTCCGALHARETSAFAPIRRLFTRDISIDDLHEWQELVYDSCTECGRCSMVCPMGINIARGVNVMREALSEAGLAPLELMAVAQEQAGRGTVFGVGPAELKQAVEALRGAGHRDSAGRATGRRDARDHRHRRAAVPGRAGRDGAHPEPPRSDWTLRSAGFEAANFGLLSGNETLQKAASQRLIDEALAIGARHGHPAGVRPCLPGAALGGKARRRQAPAVRGAGRVRVRRPRNPHGRLKLEPGDPRSEADISRRLQARAARRRHRRAARRPARARGRFPRDDADGRTELVLRRRRRHLPDQPRGAVAAQGLGDQARADRRHRRRHRRAVVRELPAQLHGRRRSRDSR